MNANVAACWLRQLKPFSLYFHTSLERKRSTVGFAKIKGLTLLGANVSELR